MVWRLLRYAFLIAVGAVAGFAGAAAVMRNVLPSQGDETSDDLALVAIFNGIDLESRSSAFQGGSVLAWFGGVQLDLREATPAPGARIDVRAMFGGVALRVPATWRVEASAMTFAGGIDARVAQPEEPDAPTLVIGAMCAFGGVSVTN